MSPSENDSTSFREGESPKSVFRTDRFCMINGGWYFVTREQTQEGPFNTKGAAQLAVQEYISRKKPQSSV